MRNTSRGLPVGWYLGLLVTMATALLGSYVVRLFQGTENACSKSVAKVKQCYS